MHSEVAVLLFIMDHSDAIARHFKQRREIDYLLKEHKGELAADLMSMKITLKLWSDRDSCANCEYLFMEASTPVRVRLIRSILNQFNLDKPQCLNDFNSTKAFETYVRD